MSNRAARSGRAKLRASRIKGPHTRFSLSCNRMRGKFCLAPRLQLIQHRRHPLLVLRPVFSLRPCYLRAVKAWPDLARQGLARRGTMRRLSSAWHDVKQQTRLHNSLGLGPHFQISLGSGFGMTVSAWNGQSRLSSTVLVFQFGAHCLIAKIVDFGDEN